MIICPSKLAPMQGYFFETKVIDKTPETTHHSSIEIIITLVFFPVN
jgi:hypothetical protein